MTYDVVMTLRALASLSLVALASACTITTGPTSTEGGEGVGPAPSEKTSRCVGKPVEAYTMRDSASCAKQGSTWTDTYLECRGTSFVVNCARADADSQAQVNQGIGQRCFPEFILTQRRHVIVVLDQNAHILDIE